MGTSNSWPENNCTGTLSLVSGFALHREVQVLFSERARRPPPRGRIGQGIPTVPLESPSDPEFPRHERYKNNENSAANPTVPALMATVMVRLMRGGQTSSRVEADW